MSQIQMSKRDVKLHKPLHFQQLCADYIGIAMCNTYTHSHKNFNVFHHMDILVTVLDLCHE